LRLGFPSLLAPQSNQRGIVIAHDDPGVGAAYEAATIDKSVRI
jgi:hypothetical protein